MSLKKDFISGVMYTSLAKYSGLVIQILITSILARLLSPAEFGVIAIATVLIQFFNTISEAGIGPAIIQKKNLCVAAINSIFTFTILFGLILGALFFISSDYIADYYTEPNLKPTCRWLSLLIIFSSVDIVPNSLLLKQKNFKIIALRTISVQIITGILSIYTAWIGWGIYALILSAVSSKIIIFVVNYTLNPLFLNFNFSYLNVIKSYSFYQFCFNLINYFSRNLDKLIIGKYIGMNHLGYYEKSYRLMMLPLGNITYVLTPVMHPIFSELQNDIDKMLRNYLKLIAFIGAFSFPFMILLYFNAREIIYVFFGSQWEASVLPFKILSLTAALQVIHATASGIFQATNNTKGLFFASLIIAILMVMGFFISSIFYRTIVAVSYSFLITSTLGSFIIYIYLFKSLKKDIRLLISSLKIPFAIGIIEFTIMYLFTRYVYINNVIMSLSVKTIIIGTITTILLYHFKVIDFRKLLTKKIRDKK